MDSRPTIIPTIQPIVKPVFYSQQSLNTYPIIKPVIPQSVREITPIHESHEAYISTDENKSNNALSKTSEHDETIKKLNDDLTSIEDINKWDVNTVFFMAMLIGSFFSPLSIIGLYIINLFIWNSPILILGNLRPRQLLIFLVEKIIIFCLSSINLSESRSKIFALVAREKK